MAVQLILAPAAAGKTTYAVKLARDSAAGLRAEVRVCLATQLQAQAWGRLLAKTGGAIGIHLLTFEKLAEALLNDAGVTHREVSDPVQRRLLQSIIARQPVAYYRPIVDKPGFIEVLHGLIQELKAAQIHPDHFVEGVASLGDEPRLRELAQIYRAYQSRLQALGVADRVGLTWMAVEALEANLRLPSHHWPLLIFDGFESFTTAQLALLDLLSQRVGDLVITLHGEMDPAYGRRYRRYRQTRQRLEEVLRVEAQPLGVKGTSQGSCLRHLSANLFLPAPATKQPADPCLELLQLPDQPGEARAALRWLKIRMVQEQLSPGDVALLARDITPYLPHIAQAAAEFGLPVRVAGGRPLRENPAVASLLALLRLGLPVEGRDQPWLPRRLVVEAWRTPYFDWTPIGIQPADADLLDSAARAGRVVGGLEQWRDALEALAGAVPADQSMVEEEGDISLPTGQQVALLADKFERFWDRIQPPSSGTTSDFIRWLESLIGPDPIGEPDEAVNGWEAGSFSLDIIARAREGNPALARADTAALRALKEVLRSLIWAETIVAAGIRAGEAGPMGPLDYPAFLAALISAVEGAQYQPGHANQGGSILVADTFQARGLSFRAVALMGLAEGVFPATINEDPFLRDADREALRRRFQMPLEPSTLSAEREFFYDAVSRASDFLLLTRPRLAETGAEWVPSTFWRGVTGMIDASPRDTGGEEPVAPGEAASWPELMESLVARPEEQELMRWANEQKPARLSGLQRASRLFRQRRAHLDTPFDGDLRHLAADFAASFNQAYPWSASRLERYRTCALQFFVADVLKLEPRPEPSEGIDASQLGTIYHHIFELVYREPEKLPLDDAGALTAYVTSVANPVLDGAPSQEGFRPTAWWRQTRGEIIANVVRSIQGLASIAGEFLPFGREEYFGGARPLRLDTGDGVFYLAGFIDRVDRDDAGRIRIIDYKLGGGSGFTVASLREGKKLQLPLYALAAERALGLGRAADGFYWHILSNKPSPLVLAEYPGGIEAAYEAAIAHAWAAVTGARGGDFRPVPPSGGCPSYCPATGFCWHYAPGRQP